jgi:hypothetical protein
MSLFGHFTAESFVERVFTHFEGFRHGDRIHAAVSTPLFIAAQTRNLTLPLQTRDAALRGVRRYELAFGLGLA